LTGGHEMENFVAEFMANLMIAGLSKEDVSARGYEYALRLQTDQLAIGKEATAKMMLHAAELMVNAQPIARRIYDAHYMMR